MGRRTKYHVNLNDKEREYLRKNSSGGAWRPRAVKKALILLKADISQGAPIPDEQIAREINSSISTVRNTKLRFAKGDRLTVLKEKERSGRPKQFMEKSRLTPLLSHAAALQKDGFVGLYI